MKFDELWSVSGKPGRVDIRRGSWKQAVDYCVGKKVGDVHGFNYVEEKKMGVTEEIATLIEQGGSLRDVPLGYQMMHYRQLAEWECVCRRRHLRDDKEPWLPLELTGDDPADRIREWLNSNLFTDRVFKQKQLYVVGPSGTGKTSLVRALDRFCSIYWMPNDEEFYDEWEEGAYDLVVIDEFRGTNKISWLNRFLEGTPLNMRIKGSHSRKVVNVPVIMCSNFTLEAIYANAQERLVGSISALLNRLEIIHLFEPCFLFDQ